MPKVVNSLRYTFTSSIDFFGGASSDGFCGCGMVLMINNDHLFMF